MPVSRHWFFLKRRGRRVIEKIQGRFQLCLQLVSYKGDNISIVNEGGGYRTSLTLSSILCYILEILII